MTLRAVVDRFDFSLVRYGGHRVCTRYKVQGTRNKCRKIPNGAKHNAPRSDKKKVGQNFCRNMFPSNPQLFSY